MAHYWTTGGGLSNSCDETACIRSDNQCAKGEYRADCNGNSEGECVLCTNKPSGETHFYTSNGGLDNTCTFEECQSDCASGTYRKGCGVGSQEGSCVDCDDCGTGKFNLGCSGTNPGTCTSCLEHANCAHGFFLDGCSGINAGTCTACTNKPAAHFYVGNGNLSDSCPHQACPSCEAGLYVVFSRSVFEVF